MNTVSKWQGGERGQGLGYILITSAVLLILLVALVDLVVREMRASVMTAKKNIVLHAADAGVDRAINALQVANNWKDIPKGLVPGYNGDRSYTEVAGVVYRLKIQEGNWTPGVQMGDVDAERTITVFATQTITGDRKKIMAVVLQSTVGSALFSAGTVAIGGSAKIHWGPVVSYSSDPNSIPSPKQFPIYISAGGIGGALPPCNGAEPLYNTCVDEYSTSLGSPPAFPLEDMRYIAKGQSTYQGGNNKCYSPDETILGNKDDNTVVFWDSCDGLDYHPEKGDTICPGGSWTPTAHGIEKHITGGSWGGKGTLIIMGNLKNTGGDNQPVSMIAPKDCVGKYGDTAECADNNGAGLVSDAMWDGLIYIAGALASTGGKTVYGSMYAYDTASVFGNFQVYFKTNNKGNAFMGKSVLTKLWMERAPSASDYSQGYYNTE